MVEQGERAPKPASAQPVIPGEHAENVQVDLLQLEDLLGYQCQTGEEGEDNDCANSAASDCKCTQQAKIIPGCLVQSRDRCNEPC